MASSAEQPKKRTLNKLYTATHMISESEVLSQERKGLDRHSKIQKVLMRTESGMCNVCAAPCSSCLHIKQARMGSKNDEFSDETCQGNTGSQHSVNDVVLIKSTACDSGHHTSSETSNSLSFNSNHDCFSENAESKAGLRACDVSGASEDVEMHASLSSGVTTGNDILPLKLKYNSGQSDLTNKLEGRKILVGHEDSISCATGGNDSNKLVGCYNGEEGRKNVHSSTLVNLEAETETDEGSGELPTEAVNSLGKIEESEVKESCGLPDVQETSLQSRLVDDSDGSDIVEHDVKVCDICGDAGREDLLAICSRCTDGAEHTYCMRELIDKVPEGDWLCEECKLDEEMKSLKRDKIVTMDGNDKYQSSGLASALNTAFLAKLDKKDSDVEGNKTNKEILSAKASNKRHAENIDVVSAVKKQAAEPTVSSPKVSGPCRIAEYSRDLSFRNLYKGKVKPSHHLSSSTCSINDTFEAAFSSTGPRLQAPRGTLLKSNSFHSTNTKPKVKLVDEAVLKKQKSARESSALDRKESDVKMMGKSMSFKSASSGRLNPADAKVRMLSSKFSHGQDVNRLKQAKEWSFLERKNSFKSERSLGSSAMGNNTVSTLKSDKKLASYGENFSLPSVSNNREPKAVQSDSKLSTLSKSNSHVARRGSEMPVPLGEIKRQSCSPSAAVASSINGISCTAEQKPDQTSLTRGTSSSTFTSERPLSNDNEGLPDTLPQLRESTNLGERIRESSVICSRPNITAGGRSAPCQKCSETGHSAQSCTVENPRLLLGDASAARSSREVIDKGNDLKAAIEAAMLKKPGIYRKNKIPDQSDELSTSSTNLKCDARPQDHLLTSINTRNIFSHEEAHEEKPVLKNSTAESCKQTTVDNMKQLLTLSSEAAAFKTGDTSSIDPSDGKPFIRDLLNHVSAAGSGVLKMLTIPEHEYVWQGCFEVQKSGKLPEFRDGIQAHLSTCASPKVLEVVNKFPSKIMLTEVPRLSAWPVLFQDVGPKEDNIALYFFAKDLESYEKSYKSLLEMMMKSDRALKGNFGGVELLIFPSNHLPEKSQRWNMLYFLWGVFKVKKVNCLQDLSASPRKHCVLRDLPTVIKPLPESLCSVGPVDRDLPTCTKVCNVALASKCHASMETTNGDCDTNAFSIDQKGPSAQTNAEGQDYRFDANSLPRMLRTSALTFQAAKCTSTPLEENVDPECILDVKLQPSGQAAATISGSEKSYKVPLYLDSSPDSQLISSHSFEMSGRKNEVAIERTVKEEEGSLDTKAVVPRETMMKDQTVKNVLNNRQHNHGKRLYEESTWKVSQASAVAIGMPSWNNDVDSLLLDGERASEKQKTGHNGLYGSAERYLFPEDPHSIRDSSSVGNSIPWKAFSSESKDDDRLPDGSPNLELALGAGTKSSKQGNLPFLVGKVDLEDVWDQPPAKPATNEEDDDLSACLSLSLSYPFPDTERTVKPISKVEQLVPDRGLHVNTSLLLFEALSDKK